MKVCFLYCLLMLAFCESFAQKLPNVAVTPFVGDESVTAQQIQFLTGKFAGELMATQSFRVLDRGKMDYILKEQGFQQSGACNTSECQVQMGQLLGVDFIIGGNIVRFGSKYAFRVDYIDVSSGQVIQSVEQSEIGELENVYEALCKGAAYKLAQSISINPNSVDPKAVDSQSKIPTDAIPGKSPFQVSLKRTIALALWATSVASVSGGLFFNSNLISYGEDYTDAYNSHSFAETNKAYENTQSAATYRNIGYGISIGTFLVGCVLWFYPEGR